RPSSRERRASCSAIRRRCWRCAGGGATMSCASTRPPASASASPRRFESSMKPDVAVVIGNYQGARLLPDCLESVRTQTLPPSAVVVVVGGSTHDGARVAEQLGAADLRTQHRGLGHRSHPGAEAATAPLVLLANTDRALDARC